MQNLPRSEQAFRPIYEWNFGALRQTLSSIGDLIADAPLFHSMMWLVTAAGLAIVLIADDEALWLAVICATVWLGYNVFLLIVYIGVMSNSDAQIAADYWRYTPHAALLGLYTPVMALSIARWPARLQAINLRGIAPTLVAILLALCAMPIRRDLNNPDGRPWHRFLRDATNEMQHLIPFGVERY